MNGSARPVERTCSGRAVLMTAGILVVAGFLLSACGGPSTPSVATGSTATTGTVASSSVHGSSGATGLLAYSSCVRSHGVASFPDPTSKGGIPKETAQQLRVRQSQLQAAQSDCTHLLPAGGTLSGTNNQTITVAAAAVLPQSGCLHALARRRQLPRTQLLRRLCRVPGARTSSRCRLTVVQARLRHLPKAPPRGTPLRRGMTLPCNELGNRGFAMTWGPG